MNNVISVVKESNGKEISTFKCKIIQYIVCSVTLAVYSRNTEYIMFIYRAKGLEWCDFTLHFCKWWLQCLSHDNLLSLCVCVCCFLLDIYLVKAKVISHSRLQSLKTHPSHQKTLDFCFSFYVRWFVRIQAVFSSVISAFCPIFFLSLSFNCQINSVYIATHKTKVCF